MNWKSQRKPDEMKLIRQRVVRRGRLQHLVCVLKLWRIQIFLWTLDTEEVPGHVDLCWRCFGDTGGWVSKFAPFDRRGWKENKA